MRLVRMSVAVVTVIAMFGIATGLAAAKGDRSADLKLATAGIFVAGDFPGGWRAETPKKGVDERALEIARAIPACKQLVAARKRTQHAALKHGGTFTHQGDSVSSSAAVFPTEAAAVSVYEAYTSPKAKRCLVRGTIENAKRTVAEKQPDADVKVTGDVGTITGDPVGDGSVHYQLHIAAKVTPGFGEENVYLDSVYARVGRALVSYQFQTSYDDSTATLPTQLVDTGVGRITAALAGQPLASASEPAPLGTTLTGGDGAKVTVFSYQGDVPGKYGSPGEFSEGPAGSVWGQADVQVCAPSAADSFTGGLYNFKLVFPDNTTARATSAPQDPELDSSPPAAGACARGNIGFVVPASRVPSAVVYDASPGKPQRWKAG